MHCSYGEGHPPSPGGCVATPPPTGTNALSQEVSPCLGRLGVLAGKAGGRAVTRVWSPCGARRTCPAARGCSPRICAASPSETAPGFGAWKQGEDATASGDTGHRRHYLASRTWSGKHAPLPVPPGRPSAGPRALAQGNLTSRRVGTLPLPYQVLFSCHPNGP